MPTTTLALRNDFNYLDYHAGHTKPHEWPAWYSRCVIWHVVSCGQCSILKFCRVVSWPVCYTRCFMWFRVASVVLEMFHVVSCGQLEIRDVSSGFLWPG